MMHPPVGPRTDLTERIGIETPENVVIEFELAGIGSRAAATLVDLLIIVALLVVLLLTFPGLVMTGAWGIALLTITLFLLFWGYFVGFEAMGGGRTPGKRALGIRVVMATGHRAPFGALAVRNVLRVVDAQPGLT